MPPTNDLPPTDDVVTQLIAVRQAIAKVNKTIADENEIRAAENEKRDKRITTNRRWTRVVAIVGAIGVLVAIGAVFVAAFALGGSHEAKTAAAEAKAAQIELSSDAVGSVRYGSCINSNVEQRTAITGSENELQGLLEGIVALQTDPAKRAQTQQAVNALVPTIDKDAVAAHPLRDCSPEGIAAFLTGHGGYVSTTTTTTTTTVKGTP